MSLLAEPFPGFYRRPQPDTRTDEINRRIAMYAALTRTGTTLERLQFTCWRLAELDDGGR